MPDERDRFPRGLARDMRDLWRVLLDRFFRYQELYLFMRECYPVRNDTLLEIYMPKHIMPQLQIINNKYNDFVHHTMEQAGIHRFKMMYSDRAKTVPGHSPIKVISEEFYGIRAFQQNAQIAGWFRSKALTLVTIFDHRCYHKQNEIGEIDQSEYPEPTKILIPQIVPTINYREPAPASERTGLTSLSKLIPAGV